MRTTAVDARSVTASKPGVLSRAAAAVGLGAVLCLSGCSNATDQDFAAATPDGASASCVRVAKGMTSGVVTRSDQIRMFSSSILDCQRAEALAQIAKNGGKVPPGQ